MRIKTLFTLCVVSAVIIVIFINFLLAATKGIRFPVFILGGATAVIAFVLLIPLALINKRLLAWRKAHGRDILEEENYENPDSGFISLQPRYSSNETSKKDNDLK